MDTTRTMVRNRRASAAYRRRLREAAAPTARDAAAALLDAAVDQAARSSGGLSQLAAMLVARGYDPDASAKLVGGMLARRAEALSARQC